MISVAVTGGIGAGKSTVSAQLRSLGAVVVDSDALAREVLASGTPGLAAVAEHFGRSVLAADGSLDRAALAGIVFADPDARRRLEGITHPLIRRRYEEVRDAVAPGTVVVNDIPLLRTVEAAAEFHLAIGVGAPVEVRIARLLGRGLTEDDARARIAAQLDDEDRRALCDVWLENSGGRAELVRAVSVLWTTRLLPFAANAAAGVRAVRAGPVLVPPDPRWPALARLLAARISMAAGGGRVDHIGSTAVPGLPAKDVLDLQLTTRSLGHADDLMPALRAIGLVPVAAVREDVPHPVRAGRAGWCKRFCANADPGQTVNLSLRVRDWPNWRFALLMRDWLRADPGVRGEYLAVKVAAAESHRDLGGYTDAKEPWLQAAGRRAEAWALATGWRPA